MTPQQALDTIMNVVSQLKFNRADTLHLIACENCLRAALAPVSDKTDDSKPEATISTSDE